MPYIISLLLLCFGLTSAQAQQYTRTILWKVQQHGNPNISYLFGTYHTASPAFFDSLTVVVEKLQQANMVLIEEKQSTFHATHVDIEKEKWDSTKWQSYLTPTQQAVFTQFKQKAEDTTLYQYSPLVVLMHMNQLYTQFFCESEPYTGEPLDHHIEKIATQQNKSIVALDTLQTHLLTTASISYTKAQQAQLIEAAIQLMHNMLQENLDDCSFFQQYKSLNINYQLDTDYTKLGIPGVLLVERNNSWMKVLKRVLLTHNCFIAVGLKHLFYQQGLIQQLRGQGFTVEPVLL